MDLLARVKKGYKDLSKSHKKLADYMIENYDSVVFMTASELGKVLQISESTVVRFAKEIGYKGYPELQKALQDTIKTKLTTVQRFAHSKDEHSDLRQVMIADIENIKHAIEDYDSSVMDSFIRELISAKKVYLLGLRSSSVLANYLGFYLNFLLSDVNVINENARDVYDQLIHMDSDDVLVAFSFPRYSKRTYYCVDHANSQGTTILGVTDTVDSPLFSKSKFCLTAPYSMQTFVDSLAAPLSLVNSLIVGVSLKVEGVEDKLSLLEDIWQKYNIYAE